MTFDNISASVGSLLLIWSAIERSAREEVIRAHGCVPKSAHGIAAVLEVWEGTVNAGQPATSLAPLLAKALRAKLQRPREIRNGICHGLIGISAARDNMPAALYWEIKGEKHSISWEELQAEFSWLSKIHWAISIISKPHIESLKSMLADNAENREWWLTEYGLTIPME